MRHRRTVVVGLSAVTATAMLGAGLQHARAAQTRGTLQVNVQVVAPCTARLGDTGRLAMAAGCAKLSAPFAVMTEGAAPSLPVGADDAEPQPMVVPETTADVRYITLLY